MLSRKNYWQVFRNTVLAPKVDFEKVDAQLRQSNLNTFVPVIWLLGKTQSGKTSIIRAITGSTKAEIGNGFRPCTRTASLYAFPDQENCLLRFLDTRGLGEVGYDPTEDLAYSQQQSHLVLVVIKAMDHAQKPVLDALKAIKKSRSNWPILVVQTALHEGYRSPTEPHVLPYPFDSATWPEVVPPDLARSIQHQREEFAAYTRRFVAVDLTMPEDGLAPANYGVESLWSAIEEEFPRGLRALLETRVELREELGDVFYRAAWPHIVSYSVAAGGAGAVPWPLVDVPVVLAIQAKMFHAISSIYGQPLTAQLMTEFSTAVGSSMLIRIVRSFFTKLVPVFGSVFGAVYNAATTYALGCSLCWYFAKIRSGSTPDTGQLREFYAKELQEGRRRFGESLKQGRESSPPSKTNN
jgi:uncharacterized protein (DUF697 family)